MLGGGGVVEGGGYAENGGWCCADVINSRTGLVSRWIGPQQHSRQRQHRRGIPLARRRDSQRLTAVQVLFDVLFNYEALLRYERQSVATGGQPYVACALNA